MASKKVNSIADTVSKVVTGTARETVAASTGAPFVGGMATSYTGPSQPSVTSSVSNVPSAAAQTPTKSAEDIYWEQRQAYEAQQRAQAQSALIAGINAQFALYGLGSLGGKIAEYVKSGYSGDTIALLLRQTDEYKARFPAMAALAAKGRAISEGQYIQYEQNVAELEQMYGLPGGMLSSRVTNFLTGDMSLAELKERANMAALNSMTAPQDFKDMMRDYYGISSGDLTAYYLDPDIALPYLEERVATAKIGTEARRQGINVDLLTAGGLEDLGVTEGQARQGFGAVRSAQGLQYGRGETASQSDLIGGVFGNADLANKMQRIAQGRANRFATGGGFATDRQGYAGLGGANR